MRLTSCLCALLLLATSIAEGNPLILLNYRQNDFLIASPVRLNSDCADTTIPRSFLCLGSPISSRFDAMNENEDGWNAWRTVERGLSIHSVDGIKSMVVKNMEGVPGSQITASSLELFLASDDIEQPSGSSKEEARFRFSEERGLSTSADAQDVSYKTFTNRM